MSTSPSERCNPTWLGPVHVATVFVNSYVYQSLKTLFFFGVIHPHLAPTIFLFLHLQSFLRLVGKGFDEEVLFKTECSKDTHSLHIVQLWVLLLVSIYKT